MVSPCIDILLIAAVYVFGIDVCRFWDTVSAAVKGWLTHGALRTPFQLKPFGCSLCMTFWTGLLYLLLAGRLTLPMVAYVCLVAMLTPRIKDLLLVADGLLAALFNLILNKLC